jgi:hypothetical protein
MTDRRRSENIESFGYVLCYYVEEVRKSNIEGFIDFESHYSEFISMLASSKTLLFESEEGERSPCWGQLTYLTMFRAEEKQGIGIIDV